MTVDPRAYSEFLHLLRELGPAFLETFESPKSGVSERILDRVIRQRTVPQCVGTVADGSRCPAPAMAVGEITVFCAEHQPTGFCRSVMAGGAACLRPAVDFCDEHLPKAWYRPDAR